MWQVPPSCCGVHTCLWPPIRPFVDTSIVPSPTTASSLSALGWLLRFWARSWGWVSARGWSDGRSWGSSVTSAINVPLDFRNGPGVGLQTHTAVFAAFAIAAAGVSTTEVEVHTIRATCAALAVVAIATTGVSLGSHSAVYAGVAIIIVTTGVSRDFQNGPGVGLHAHAASGVSIWAHRAVVVVVAVAASAATTPRACVACTARHAEGALARHIGKSMGASRSGLLSQKGRARLLRLGYFAGATTAAAAVKAAVATATIAATAAASTNATNTNAVAAAAVIDVEFAAFRFWNLEQY